MCLPCIDFLRKSRFYYMMEWKLEVVLDYQQLLMTIWDFFAVDLGNECVLSKINLFFFFFFKPCTVSTFCGCFYIRLLGWWSIDEGSREEQARLYFAQESGWVFCTNFLLYNVERYGFMFGT